jgi:hypothetical protein
MARRSVHSQQNDQDQAIWNDRLTKCNNIKDFDRFVGSCRRKTAPIGTDTRATNLARVGSELLHELDAIGHLLPELDEAID